MIGFTEIPSMPPEWMQKNVERQRLMNKWLRGIATDEEKDRIRQLKEEMEAMSSEFDAKIKNLLT